MRYYNRRRLIKHKAWKIFITNFYTTIPVCILLGLIYNGFEAVLNFIYAILVSGLSDVCAESTMAFLIFCLILLICPLVAGVSVFFRRIATGHADASVIMSCYGSAKAVLRAVKYFLPLLIAVLAVMCLPMLFYNITLHFRNFFANQEVFKLLRAVILFAIVLLSAHLTSLLLFALCLYDPSKKEYTVLALRNSITTLSGHKMEFLFFNLSFLPMLVVCYMLLGLLFIPFFVPYYCISANIFATYCFAEKHTPVFYSLS